MDQRLPQGTRRVVKRRTRTLAEVLDELGVPAHVDLLSLDSEGSELEILKGADLGRRSFSYILLEHNFREPQR
ncbi:unnamed protein product, partial [Polarella glacialis]